MFSEAIEKVAQFTTPIHTIHRWFGTDIARPGSATMFFVNDRGDAVTCKHVAELIEQSGGIGARYHQYKAEKQQLLGSVQEKELMDRYGWNAGQMCELLVRLHGAADFDTVEILKHPHHDLAVIRMVNARQIAYTEFARFAPLAHQVPQGKFLCRLGFPFPEFSNFSYDAATDSIGWTPTGNAATPRFPLEGMVTRHLADASGVYGIEMSTPGLRGQSGGPLFDDQGIVHGMQFATNHLHLGFDMHQKEILSNGEKIHIANYQPFLHVGWCLNAAVITDFLRENNVPHQFA